MAINVSVKNTVSKDAGSAISTGVKQYMEDGADVGFAQSQELVPQDRGTLLQSGFPPEWTSDGSLQYGYRANHASHMEFGTEPFQPPVAPLVEWSERVTGGPGLGYYVALHKIPTEGIDSQPYLRPAADKQKRWYSSRDIAEYIENEF